MEMKAVFRENRGRKVLCPVGQFGLETAEADDGELHAVTGEMRSIMAGFCCGEPSPLAWEILRDYADGFISMPDAVAARGMRS